MPGTNLYFCPQSGSPEKVRRLTELFGRLVLPDDRVFPEGSVEVTLREIYAKCTAFDYSYKFFYEDG